MTTPKIEVKKDFNVSAEMIYEAWLDPKALKEFIKPGDIVEVPNPVVDPRVGGQFLFEMHVGENRLPHKGEYKILDKPSKIQFTWNSSNTNNEDSVVTIDIAKTSESSCSLTLTHELLPSLESRNDHKGGWNNILKHLEGFSLR